MRVLKWVWQFPQNLVGFLMSRRPESIEEYKGIKVYYTHNTLGCGVSLGDYIIMDADHLKLPPKDKEQTIKHEYGHHRQSLYLGWLYLLVVGLWSAIRNRYHVWFHKDWESAKATAWYYGSFPENWADKLGEVERFS